MGPSAVVDIVARRIESRQFSQKPVISLSVLPLLQYIIPKGKKRKKKQIYCYIAFHSINYHILSLLCFIW